MFVRSGLDQERSSFVALLDRVALCKFVRRVRPGRNTAHVSNPGQGDAPLVELRTTLLPLRMTGSSAALLILLAAHTLRRNVFPTDHHSLLMCPNCGIFQDSTVC